MPDNYRGTQRDNYGQLEFRHRDFSAKDHPATCDTLRKGIRCPWIVTKTAEFGRINLVYRGLVASRSCVKKMGQSGEGMSQRRRTAAGRSLKKV